MIELSKNKVAYLSELRKHERKWVAVRKTAAGDMIVGSGQDAAEAKLDARTKGFTEVVLFWVRPFNGRYISAP